MWQVYVTRHYLLQLWRITPKLFKMSLAEGNLGPYLLFPGASFSQLFVVHCWNSTSVVGLLFKQKDMLTTGFTRMLDWINIIIIELWACTRETVISNFHCFLLFHMYKNPQNPLHAVNANSSVLYNTMLHIASVFTAILVCSILYISPTLISYFIQHQCHKLMSYSSFYSFYSSYFQSRFAR